MRQVIELSRRVGVRNRDCGRKLTPLRGINSRFAKVKVEGDNKACE